MDAKELAALLAQIEESSEPVDVVVSGEDEASLNLTVTTKRKSAPLIEEAESSTPVDSRLETETLLNVNFNDVEVSDEYIDERISAALNKSFPGVPNPIIQQQGATKDWKLVVDYTYETVSGTPNSTITVFAGFIYDRSSIPRIVWPIISKDDLSAAAPLLHDLLYRNGGRLPETESPPHTTHGQVQPLRTFSREDTDKLFRELMERCGVHPLRRRAAFRAVRLAGGAAWKD
jgi:Protein of unknown function (DUF1353)